METPILTLTELLQFAQLAHADVNDEAKPDKICRAFVARVSGHLQATLGQAAADQLVSTLGMHHLVGNNPARYEHLRSYSLLSRADAWKANTTQSGALIVSTSITPTLSTQEASHV